MNIRITRLDPDKWGAAWKRLIAECESTEALGLLRAAWRRELRAVMKGLHS
jgi:hypothetical protein